MMKRVLSGIILMVFILTSVVGPTPGWAQVMRLPGPRTMLATTPAFMPAMIKGIRIRPQDPLVFDFLIDTGDSGVSINSSAFKAESEKLIKYFLASLAIKGDDVWVNLSPQEKDRIMSEPLGQTTLGRDMLAQDYILKQLTASLIYPENDLGRSFWNEVYARAQKEFGTTAIPVDTFNKVWITADKARVLERNNTGYVVGSHLKVMLESDYLATSNNPLPTGGHVAPQGYVSPSRLPSDQPLNVKAPQGVNPMPSELTKNILREIIIPVLEKEVNEGKNFALLRQMFNSMILASWYKRALKGALLNEVYTDKARISGVSVDDPAIKEKIYGRYLEAYKQGVFNYIKEEQDAVTGENVPRKYFSGGVKPGKGMDPDVVFKAAEGDELGKKGDMAAVTTQIRKDDQSHFLKVLKFDIERMPSGANRRQGVIKEMSEGHTLEDFSWHYWEISEGGHRRILGYSKDPDIFLDKTLFPVGASVVCTGILRTLDESKDRRNLEFFLSRSSNIRYRAAVNLDKNSLQRPNVKKSAERSAPVVKLDVPNANMMFSLQSTEIMGSDKTTIEGLLWQKIVEIRGDGFKRPKNEDIGQVMEHYQVGLFQDDRLLRIYDSQKGNIEIILKFEIAKFRKDRRLMFFGRAKAVKASARAKKNALPKKSADEPFEGVVERPNYMKHVVAQNPAVFVPKPAKVIEPSAPVVGLRPVKVVELPSAVVEKPVLLLTEVKTRTINLGFSRNNYIGRTIEEVLLEKLCAELGKKAKENTLDSVLALFGDYKITGGRGAPEVITPGRPALWITWPVEYVLDEGDRVMFSGEIDAAEAPLVDGGIDLDENKMVLDIISPEPGIEVHIGAAELERFRTEDFSGVVPVILQIRPATDPAVFLL